ncbi:GCG_CRPN prefix-to-repeats domain-containing protein [Methylobacterium sp. J-070]|uniref:GCG_CRPN prefix-to-repeats domain-containing protein n=1 Tax=Methylobacterium sp. J-070 TaxID=2836650 RepID=UPI003919957F
MTAAAITATVTPASALGGCGPNGHRNRFGYCVFGGQNQAFCMRTRGHPAVRMPNGTLRCF